MKVLSDIVPDSFDGASIYSFLHHSMGLSVTLIKKVKWGCVFVDGKNVNMRARIAKGQLVEVQLIEDKPSEIVPIEFPLDILYEDEYLLCVNKPKNMPTHPSRGNSLPTLAQGVAAYLGEPFVFRSINRLDRDTSGIVLIAKDAYCANKLSLCMKRGGFLKKYIAITSAVPEPRFGTIDAPIARECEGSIKRVVREDGKRAVTEYRVLDTKGSRALVEFILHTGRTHQIRVHTAYIGAPLYADFLYGERIINESYMLHAYYLSFTHPHLDKTVEITSPTPFSL